MKQVKIMYTDTTSLEAQNQYLLMYGQAEKKERHQRRYYLKQRAVGVAMLAGTVFAVLALEGDPIGAIVTVPLAMCLLISEEMLIVDRYYREVKEEKKNVEISEFAEKLSQRMQEDM